MTKKRIALAVAGTAAVAATVGTLYAIFRKRKSLKDMMTPRLRKFTPAQRTVFLKESHNRNLPGNTAYDVVKKADEAVQRTQSSRKMQNQYRKHTLKRYGRKGSTSRFNFGKVATVVLGVLVAFAIAGGTAHAFMSKSAAPSSSAAASSPAASSPAASSPAASSPAASSPNAFHRPQIYKYPGIGEKQGPKAMLHKMLDIWENKGPRSTIGNIEWKSIYDTIPANIQRKIIPDGRYGRTGFISHTLKWLFNSGYLKGFTQAKNQVIEPDLWSLQEPSEGYVLYATIYNTGAHYIAYFINTTELQNRHVFEFNALHSSNPQSKIINTDTSDSFSERFDISMEKTRFNDCILNRQPADVITKNGENGCHINTLWYVLTGFPELRKYIKQQTGYV